MELQTLESPHTFVIRTTPFRVSGRTVVPSSFIFPARNSSNVSCISNKKSRLVEVITGDSDWAGFLNWFTSKPIVCSFRDSLSILARVVQPIQAPLMYHTTNCGEMTSSTTVKVHCPVYQSMQRPKKPVMLTQSVSSESVHHSTRRSASMRLL